MKFFLNYLLLGTFICNTRYATVVRGNLLGEEQSSIIKKHLEEVKSRKEEEPNFSENLNLHAHILEEKENEELYLPSKSVVADTPFLDNDQVTAKLSTTAETLIFSSSNAAVKIKNRVKSQFQYDRNNNSDQIYTSYVSEEQEYVVHAEPKIQVEAITEETLKKEINESEFAVKSSQEELKKAPQHEDIPSFSEWTQKQLAEAEKKKNDQNDTIDRSPKTRGKFRNKNYASPDCGAKIVAANPESLSSSSVLSSLKDEYMLNYCTNRIWFVVELCEAIQAKQLDLANFELFSSSPKHFSVFLSHRFPTREWSNVGKFTAQDTRDVQTFNLHPHLFGKFVKVELHSHYGREQFCPISWVGAFGTSEYEVLAKEDGRHSLPDDDEGDSYDEDLFEGHRRDSPKNLFSSATDAVLSIVKKATAPFMKTDSNASQVENSVGFTNEKNAPCITPRHITVCNNCSQCFYDEVFSILSCQQLNLMRLVFDSFVKRVLIESGCCTKFGLDFGSLRTGAPFPRNYLHDPGREVNYLTVMLKDSFLASLCNVLAVFESKVVVNSTVGPDHTLRNVTRKKEVCSRGNVSESHLSSEKSASSSCTNNHRRLCYTKSKAFTDIFKPSERFSEKIEPTKTLTEDQVKMLPPSEVYPETMLRIEEDGSNEIYSGSGQVTSTVVPTYLPGNTRNDVESSVKKESGIPTEDLKVEGDGEAKNKSSDFNDHFSTLESIIGEMNSLEKENSVPGLNVPSTNNLPAESIFLRLANRIKNLEINMSLSSTYLEELSKRYRTQLELLSKTLNLTLQKIEEHSRSKEESERKNEKEISLLRTQIANLTREVSVLMNEKNSWRPRASSISQHFVFISLEILFVWTVLNYKNRLAENKNMPNKCETLKKTAKKFKRRNSLEGVRGHETPRRKTRRPSDEALEIALSRNHLDEFFRAEKKRKRKKKDSKCSVHVVQPKQKKSESALVGSNEDKPSEGPEAAETDPAPGKAQTADSGSLELEVSNRFAAISEPSPRENLNTVVKALKGLSPSPMFMKTALAARNSRPKRSFDKESSQRHVDSVRTEEPGLPKKDPPKERKTGSSLKKYMKKLF